MEVEQLTKKCTCCGEEKPISEFYKNKNPRYKYGVEGQCKICRNGVVNKRRDSISPGVYGLFSKLNGECLYIGESNKPAARKDKHLTDYLSSYKKGKETLSAEQVENRYKQSRSKSLISEQITRDNLKKENIEFRLLEEVDGGLQSRREREKVWKQKLNPIFDDEKK